MLLPCRTSQVQPKLDVLKANLGKLVAIPQASYDEFSGDFRNVASALHLLQSSIGALLDLGSFVVAHRALATPRTSHVVFERLEEAELLPAGTAASFAPVIGFRNRVVHLYDRIDERRVYEILVHHRQDLAKMLDQLLSVLED